MKSTITLARKAVLLTLLALSGQASLLAQMRVGLPVAPADGSAALEITSGPYSTGSQYRGLLPPKVALTGTNLATPITSKPAIGLLVFNTATQNDVTPGYYYWEGTKWVRLSTGTSGNAGARLATAGLPIKNITDPTYGSPTNNDYKNVIQTALNGGGTIYVPEGEYQVSGTLNVGSNTILFGPGTIKLTSTSSVPVLSVNASSGAINNVVIRDITLDGNEANIPNIGSSEPQIGAVDLRGTPTFVTTNVTIENVTIKNVQNHGIEADHIKRLFINGCKIVDFRNRGINVEFSYEANLSSNYVDGDFTPGDFKGQHGIQMWGSNPAIPTGIDSRNYVAANNLVKNISGGGIWAGGIENAAITGNYVQSCNDVGIDVELSNNISIAGNTVIDCTVGGITTYNGGSDITISGNQVKQGQGMGPGVYFHALNTVRNVTVSGNGIHTYDSPGIYSDQGNTVTESLIANNVIVADRNVGIRLVEADAMEIIGNRITVGLAANQGNVSASTGVWIEGGNNCTITSNTITSKLDTSPAGTMAGNDLRGGVHLYFRGGNFKAQRNTVSNNVIRGFQIAINDNCWGDALSWNFISHNRANTIAYRSHGGSYQGSLLDNRGLDNPGVNGATASVIY